MKKQNILSTLALATMVALAASCSNDENLTDGNRKTDNDESAKGVTIFGTTEKPSSTTLTHTSMLNHTYKTGGDFMWEQNDQIWVENGSTRIKSTSNSITKTQPRAKFMVPGTFTALNYNVYYTGTTEADGNNVTIATTQTQNGANNTKHFGVAGDCGTAKATRVGNLYEFDLDHKANYLCFLPRVTNTALAPNVFLTKVVVKSDNNIAGTYTLNMDGLQGAGSAKEITLTTKGSGNVPGPWNTSTNSQTSVPAPGIPISSSTQITNAAYMIIAPGIHKLGSPA